MKHLLPAVLLCATLLGGCATVGTPSPKDPLQGLNRGTQAFNDAVDEAALKPLAEAWEDYVPQPVRTGVRNFFGNLEDGWSAINHLLQAKPEPALNMTLRVAVNTVFGLGGVLDVASEAGLDREPEDLGQTLGRWGMPAGPYLVLPLLGPSTLRDTAALPLDMTATSTALVTGSEGKRLSGTLVNVVSTRARFLGAGRLLDDIALDRYSFLRDAYLARRQNQVYDGDPPEEGDDAPQ